MYPANKKMDGVQSATGVFYQAMPAVGADGKNIMKLIPVQMINGRFFQTNISKPKTDPAPQKAVSVNIASAPVQKVKKAALDACVAQQIIRKVSLMNVLPHESSDLCNSLNKRPLQQKIVNLLPKVPPMATAAAHCEKPQFSGQLPVTVKSPALPSGQYLQIPPNAQVRTVPASELPPGIKKQIFTSSASSPPASGLPSVVYVSPITTVNQSVMPPSDSARHLPKLLPKASNISSCEPPQKHLKLIPKVAQRPNSPLKWMVEEEESSAAPPLDPLNSSSMTSEILLAVKERENACKLGNVLTKPISQLSPGKSRQGQENALVMCNGKVFFVAKKSHPSIKTGTSSSPAAATKSHESAKTVALSPEKRQDLSIIISDESDEVIDLCDDDDSQDDLSQQTASVNMSTATHLDEDNVIFVSYIPPKSESGSAQDLIANTQKAAVAEADQKVTCSSKSLEGATAVEGRVELSALKGRKPDQSVLACAVNNLGGSAEVSVPDNEGANVSSQQSTSSRQSEDHDVDTEGPDARTSVSGSGICSQIEEDIHIMESSVSPATSSSLTPQSRPVADHLLRQIFQITADVKICLQRIDEASFLPVPAEPLQNECIGDREEPASGQKEALLPDPCGRQQTDNDKGLISVEAVTEQEQSADPAASSPHPHVGPIQCSHFKRNSNPLSTLTCNSGQKLLTPCVVETEPVMGFVEPIDEDFLSSDENDSQDIDTAPQTPTCVDSNVNTRRIGRTRKRTVCPCCIPGTEVPAAKSSAKSVEPEKWAGKAEKTSKKGGRTKAARKEEKTSGKISCLTAKNKQKCKSSEVPASLSTASVDSEELTRLEKIKRLKEILRDKEAALELMRNSS